MRIFLIYTFFLFAIVNGAAQTIKSPTIEKKDNDNIGILEIELNPDNTIVHFIYQSDSNYIKGGWVNINPKIKIKEAGGYRSYSLVKAVGVPLAPLKKELDFKGQYFSFRLIFPNIPSHFSKIDIVECSTSNCFNFYGVSLESDESNQSSSKPKNERFRRDYDMISIYDSDTKEWSKWKSGENTFVMNYNNNGDIAHYKPSGDMVIYKKISEVEKDYTKTGEHYQIITALDEDGMRFKFQFFDKESVGLKMIYGDIMIQFVKKQE